MPTSAIDVKAVLKWVKDIAPDAVCHVEGRGSIIMSDFCSSDRLKKLPDDELIEAIEMCHAFMVQYTTFEPRSAPRGE